MEQFNCVELFFRECSCSEVKKIHRTPRRISIRIRIPDRNSAKFSQTSNLYRSTESELICMEFFLNFFGISECNRRRHRSQRHHCKQPQRIADGNEREWRFLGRRAPTACFHADNPTAIRILSQRFIHQSFFAVKLQLVSSNFSNTVN